MSLKSLFAATALLLFSGSVMAQSATDANPAAEHSTEKKESKFKAFADQHLNLSGYLQTGFEWNQINDPETSFYVKRARVSLTGNFLKEKFDYRLQVDMAGSPKICDLYIRYMPFDELNFEIGQFKIPFSYENENCGPTTVEFIEYSYITTYLARNNGMYDGIAATGRDLGFQIYGDLVNRDGESILKYNVGVFNGAGINCKDNNSAKDFIARLIVRPFKGFAVTGSYMYAKTYHLENDMKSPRWSVGALYESRHWVARSEFAQANFDDNITNAFYVLGGYNFEQPWSVYARYEFINDEVRIMDRERFGLGTAYKPFKFLRLQFNLSYEKLNDFPKEYRHNFGANLMVTAIF